VIDCYAQVHRITTSQGLQLFRHGGILVDRNATLAELGLQDHERLFLERKKEHPLKVNICISDADGVQTFFKMKRRAPMRKLFAAYADRKQLLEESLEYRIPGSSTGALDPERTATENGLQDWDMIIVEEVRVEV